MSETAIDMQECCGGDHSIQALSVPEAHRRIAMQIQPTSGFEKLSLRNTLGRILAQDIRSPVNVPAHTNSAMDGYAVNSVDLPIDRIAKLNLIGTAWAGKPFDGSVQHGQCVRIMTGAVVPQGADTVIMQEHTQSEGDTILIDLGHKPGQNVRAAGEDIGKGQLVLNAGKQILPSELGLLASLGMAEIAVKRRLRVAFFSTGDELRSIGESLSEGEIYDSNRYTLFGMLSRLGVDIIDMGVIRDKQQAIHQALSTAAHEADAIITSGGVSVGEADYVKEALDTLGTVSFWQIAMKPGRPLAFGHIDTTVFFGLPGNPVSVMVCFYQFVEPALRRMMGQNNPQPAPIFKVSCASHLKKRPGRTEFQRGVLETGPDGNLAVRVTGQQGSGILHSMSAANCFVILPSDSQTIEPGTQVEVQPFYGLL